MKEKLAILVAAMLLGTLTACGDGGAASASSSSASSEVASTETTSATDSNDQMEIDKKLLTVEITIPASMFSDGTDAESENESAEAGLEAGETEDKTPEEYCEEMRGEDGVLDAHTNAADGSVTLIMTKAKHQETMDEMKASIEESLAEGREENNYPSIKEELYNDDLTEFTIKVNREQFEGSFDAFSVLQYGFVGCYYQIFDGVKEPKVTIEYVDVDTGEQIISVVFPDDIGDTGEETPAESDGGQPAA